jgi:hypothetical protein
LRNATYKECGFRFKLVVTPEFRSTKVDCYDDSTLQRVAVKTTPRIALRGVLWNVLRREFVSRDLNAALNIRRFLISRPPILRRELAALPPGRSAATCNRKACPEDRQAHQTKMMIDFKILVRESCVPRRGHAMGWQLCCSPPPQGRQGHLDAASPSKVAMGIFKLSQ